MEEAQLRQIVCMSLMQIAQLRQIAAGTLETESKQEPQKETMTTNAPNKIVQKASKYVGAGEEIEGGDREVVWELF